MKQVLVALSRQPLLHFLLAGALLFVVHDWLAAPEDDALARRIVVDEVALLNFLQFRAQSFDPATFASLLASYTPEERAQLVQEYVREEALYREAVALGLQDADYSIRQRLVQQMEFLLESMLIERPEPSDEELRAWFEQRSDDYRVDQAYDFTHVFFDASEGGMDAAAGRAREWLATAANIPAEDAERHGDVWPFLQNYSERSREFVMSNFSAAFVDGLENLMPDAERWQGPVASRYGQHLVLLRARSAARLSTFEEARWRVLEEYQYASLLRARQEAEARVMADYEVVLEWP
jgi:hypothetical protein